MRHMPYRMRDIAISRIHIRRNTFVLFLTGSYRKVHRARSTTRQARDLRRGRRPSACSSLAWFNSIKSSMASRSRVRCTSAMRRRYPAANVATDSDAAASWRISALGGRELSLSTCRLRPTVIGSIDLKDKLHHCQRIRATPTFYRDP